MKKIIIVLTVFLTTVSGFSQSVFDKFEDKEDVTSIILNPKMFRMLATMGINLDDPEAQAYVDMAKNITGFKVFTTGNESISADMGATVAKYLKTSSLEELMRINDDGKKVNIYVNSGASENIVKELLMFIDAPNSKDNQAVVLSLTGNFNLDEISALTEKMSLPGGEELKKASKSKK